jgi:hypothetical protein
MCLQRLLVDADKLTKKDLHKLATSISRMTAGTALTDAKLLKGVVTCLKKVMRCSIASHASYYVMR